MYLRFIAIDNQTGYSGYFGTGDTEELAKKNLKKAGGKSKGCRLVKFTSKIPFCPATEKREATENEADAWVDLMGGMNWVRCEREWITQ